MPTYAKAVGLLLLMVPQAAWSQERDLQLINDDIDALGKQIADVTQSDLGLAAASGQRSFERVLDQAETFFVLRDYTRAALLLLPLCEASTAQAQQNFGKALYYLAESEFQIGNNTAARVALQQVIERKDAHMADAVRALIGLGDRTSTWDNVDAAVEALRAKGALRADVAYAQAKSLLLRKQPEHVSSVIADIPKSHPMYAKARYLVGVACVESKDYIGADAVFAELRQVSDDYEDAAFVRDICTLNRGRLLLEKGQPVDAVSAYGEVPKASQVFDDALYETIWTYLRQADDAKEDAERDTKYKSALQTLEIFLLGDDHPEMEPEARILMGNILTRLGRVDEAQQVFLDVVSRYTPMRDQVGTIKSKVTDPVPLFVPHGPSDLRQVSPLVATYAADESKLKRALDVSRGLNDSEQWLEEAGEMLEKLWAALDSGGSLSFYPGLRDAVFHKLTIENELVRLLARLADVEAKLVAEGLSEAQQRELTSLLAQRQAIERQRTRTPQTQEEYEKALSASVDKVQQVEHEINKLRWMIEEQRRGVDALHAWVKDNPANLDDASRSNLETEMKQHDQVTSELEANRGALMRDLEAHRAQVASGVEDAIARELRQRYRGFLERERELLDAARGKAANDARASLQVIDRDRSKITTYLASLNDLERRISEVLAQRTLEKKADLLAMQRDLEERRADMSATRDGASDVVQDIAARSLQNVQNKLNEIVLRGDVGLVDVAWQLKEEETRDISRRVNAQHNELEILDNEYKEVVNKDKEKTK